MSKLIEFYSHLNMKYGLNYSTPPRMSAPSSVCSDDSFEIVNNELEQEEPKDDALSLYKPKVTFHEVFDVYPMDADIVARVTFDNDYMKSDNDTVVVVPIAWKSIDQALCAANIDGNHVRFDVKELPKTGAEDKFYQLCYCTEDKVVMGVSIPFSFREVHEDELIEFQKERNKEFWTFRSRFAVLMDIYWNFVLENKTKTNSTENEVCVGQPAESLNEEEKPATPETETDADRNSRILLFQIMENELEELKKKCESKEASRRGIEMKLENEMKVRKVLLSIITTYTKITNSNPLWKESPFFVLWKDLIDSCPVPYDTIGLGPFPQKLSAYHTLIASQLPQEIDSEGKFEREEQLLYILKNVLTHSKFINRQTYENCATLLRNVKPLFPQDDEEFDEMLRQIKYDDESATEKETQPIDDSPSNQATSGDSATQFNAEFVATCSGDILLAPQCVEQAPLKSPVPNDADVSNNVPDDWKAEKASLSEKCSQLQAEIDDQNVIIRNLKEQLIYQTQSEVEKVTFATDTLKNAYAKDMKKLIDNSKSFEELLRIKNEEAETLNKKAEEVSALLAQKQDEIVSLEARLEKFNNHDCEASSSRRVAELEKKLYEMYSKLWSERKELVSTKEALNISQALVNSMKEAKEKSKTAPAYNPARVYQNWAASFAQSRSGFNSSGTSDQEGNKGPTAGSIRQHKREEALARKVVELKNDLSRLKCNGCDCVAKIMQAEEECIRLKADSKLYKDSHKKNLALIKKLKDEVEELKTTKAKIMADLETEKNTRLAQTTEEFETLKNLHAKNVADLEARLKEGAKQYAKLYMKHEKLTKRLQSPNSSSSSLM